MPYDKDQIARELEATAQGVTYHGNALRVAKDVPGVNDIDRSVLDRYATGLQRSTDHVALLAIANKVRNSHITSYYTDRANGAHAAKAP